MEIIELFELYPLNLVIYILIRKLYMKNKDYLSIKTSTKIKFGGFLIFNVNFNEALRQN